MTEIPTASGKLNLATVNLGMSLGVKQVVETLYRLGAQRRITAVPSVMLGSVSLSSLARLTSSPT